jgi:hypothetical protein
LESFEIQADTEETDKDDIHDVAYAAEVQLPSAFDNSDGDYEGITNGDYFDETETKQGYVAHGLNYSNDYDYINKVDIDSRDEFWSSFQRNKNSQNFIMCGPQQSDTSDMTPAQEAAALEKYKKERKLFMDKQCVALIKSIASKDVTALLQKSQWDCFWRIRTR